MAIIQCPICQKRISSVAPMCPHCQSPLGQMTPTMRREKAKHQHKAQTKRAKQLSIWALAVTFAGAMLWWFEAGQGWEWPPSIWAVTLLCLGLGAYLAGRGWLLWLYLTRSTVRRLL